MVLTYTIDLNDRNAHQIGVELQFDGAGALGTVELAMAAWTPGSYFIRNFARNVSEVSAKAGSGAPLAVRKVDKQSWRVEAGREQRIVVNYRVYAFDEGVRGAYLTTDEGFWSGAAVYLRVRGREAESAVVVVRAPASWKQISTGLNPTPGAPGTFRAASYDELVDCPFLVGTHDVLELSTPGKPVHLAISGHGNEDRGRLCSDLTRIVAAATDVFGTTPYDHYTFILRLTGDNWGGLEHANSSVNNVPATSFRPERDYRSRVLALLAHEFFHLWNVKRLRPQELGPFDYDREVYTTMLWLAEGVTNYFDVYLLRRAGVHSPDEHLETTAKRITALARVPGRNLDSLEAASFDAWIKLYITDEHSNNRSVSYYLKGGVAMLALDLDIRGRTGGERGLEDALRQLYREFYEGYGRGITTQEFRAGCEAVAGGDLSQHFEKNLACPGDIELTALFAPLGLVLERSVDRQGQPEGEAVGGWLGASVQADPGKGLQVTGIPSGSPAETGGLSAGDELLAANGFRVRTADDLAARLREVPADSMVSLLVSRRGQVRELSMVLGAWPADKHTLRRMDSPTDAQKQLYERWMFAAWPN